MTSVLETGAVFNQMFHALVSVPYLALSRGVLGVFSVLHLPPPGCLGLSQF